MNLKFIDIHTHGGFGVDFNYASYNEVKYLLKELYKKNIKGICPTLVGDKKENMQRQFSIFKKIIEEQRQKTENESIILGLHLEGSFLSPDKSGIQDKNNFLEPTVKNFKDLTGEYSGIIKIVTVAPEKDIDLINYLNENKIITQAGHTTGDNLKNAKGATHLFNAMNPIHHRNPSIALSALIKDEIYTEVIADLIHLSEDILTLILKTKQKDKILLVSDSLPVSNYDKDIIFCNKKINKYGKDENGTIAGSVKTLDEICLNLINKGILTHNQIEQFAFINQLNYLEISSREVDILNR